MTTPQPHINANLSAYLDDELGPAEVETLDAALAADPGLRAQLLQLQSVARFLGEHGQVAAPEGFHERLMERVAAEHPPPSAWAWLRQPLGLRLEGWLVAAAAVAALLLVLQQGPAPSGTDVDAWSDGPPAQTAPAAAQLDAMAKVPAESPSVPVPVTEVPTPATAVHVAPPSGQADAEPAIAEAQGPDAAPNAPADGTGEEADVLASPGYRYTVRSSAPELKLAVLRLAARYGGATTLAGAEISTAAMSGPTEDLMIHVPQPDLTRFAEELQRLGYDVDKQASNEIVRGSALPVQIRLVSP